MEDFIEKIPTGVLVVIFFVGRVYIGSQFKHNIYGGSVFAVFIVATYLLGKRNV